jgi:hypothetical protein
VFDSIGGFNFQSSCDVFIYAAVEPHGASTLFTGIFGGDLPRNKRARTKQNDGVRPLSPTLLFSFLVSPLTLKQDEAVPCRRCASSKPTSGLGLEKPLRELLFAA